MNSERFNTLKNQGYNRIPFTCEILADMDTPLSVYRKLADAPYSYLFESVQGGEKWGRYSIIGLPCRQVIRINGLTVSLEKDNQVTEQFEVEDPLAYIEQYQAQYHVMTSDDLPQFTGGLVGYFGYETIGYIETKLAQQHKPDPLNTPDILLMVSDEVVVFDNLKATLHVITHVDPAVGNVETGNRRLKQLVEQLHQAKSYAPSTQTFPEIKESDFISGFTEKKFKQAVSHIKDYIMDGDCMQVVISQRLSVPFYSPPIDLYRTLRGLNPSPYMYFMHLGDFHIVGSSPEILTRMEDNEVTVRPIAGTRRRGYNEEEDLALEKELLADPKEIAEHLMLIDLGRNDAGRVSKIGSVKLTDKMSIERYSHVMHIVSNVTGQLKPDMSAMDVLRATFPAGTVSGAPKIRAMEIIAELEPVKRGVYSGAVGYLSWNGNMDTAIAIRTAVIKDQQLHIQAGAGVVADSLPELEWKETMNKARAIFKAATLAEAGIERYLCHPEK